MVSEDKQVYDIIEKLAYYVFVREIKKKPLETLYCTSLDESEETLLNQNFYSNF